MDEQEAEDSGSDYDDWNNDDWSSINVSSYFRLTKAFPESQTEKGNFTFNFFVNFLSKKFLNQKKKNPQPSHKLSVKAPVISSLIHQEVKRMRLITIPSQHW